jgi:hypothetical protein
MTAYLIVGVKTRGGRSFTQDATFSSPLFLAVIPLITPLFRRCYFAVPKAKSGVESEA